MSTKNSPRKPKQPVASEAAQKLMRDYGDASFASGEWHKDDDEECESVSQKVSEALASLSGYIASLEANLLALGQPLPAIEPSEAELRTTVAEKEYETYDFEGDVYDYSDWGRDGPNIWTRTIELSREVLPKVRRSTKVTLYVCFGKGLAVKKVHARDGHGDLVGKRGEPVSAL